MNMTNRDMKVYGLGAAILGVLLIALSWIITDQIETPAPWLSGWTAWIATYAALVIGIGSALGLTPSIVRSLRYKVGMDGKVTDLKKITP
jgi:hypothetical protein